MNAPKDLYKELAADFLTEERYYYAERGAGMMQGREKYGKRVFLLNKDTEEAWELLSQGGQFSHWDASAVEIASAFDLPYRAQRNALELRAPYYFGINEFEDGVASADWTLQPDGRYYADEDGFGMTDDEEISFHAFIDRRGHILVPFQPMDADLKARYREQAVRIAKDREEVPYICLAPSMTIQVEENTNLEMHMEKLYKVVYGMMFQFGSQARHYDKYTENEGRIGIFTAFNPNMKEYLSLTFLGDKIEGDDVKYDVSVITCLFKEGEGPQGVCTKMGEFHPLEIEDIMGIEENADLILDDFIESVGMIYSGNIPGQ